MASISKAGKLFLALKSFKLIKRMEKGKPLRLEFSTFSLTAQHRVFGH